MEDPWAWILFIPTAIVMIVALTVCEYFFPDRVKNESLLLRSDVINIINTESVESMKRVDEWGTPVEYSYTEMEDSYVAKALSYGPDKIKSTEDDILKSAKTLKKKKNIKIIWELLKN